MKWPHFASGIAFEVRRIGRQPIGTLLVKAAVRAASVALWPLLLPLTLVLHLSGHRRATIFTDRIGHLALEPDCLIKEVRLGALPPRRWFILAPPGRVANEHLLRYWETDFRVYRGRAICFLLGSMSRWIFMRCDVSRYILAPNTAQDAHRIQAAWGDRAPILTLSSEDAAWSVESLRNLGLPEDAWFVCVHAREGGYSPVDEELQQHRNGSIDALLPSMAEIAHRGGWVVRLGDSTMKPLPPLPRVIDYAHHPMKSARLDLVLCARARFTLGNTSGVALVSTVFGVPCAIANMIPILELWFTKRDLSIPKLLWSQAVGRHLRFDEAAGSGAGEFRYAALYAKAGLLPEENSQEDIRELVCEMFDRIEGRFVASAEDDARWRQFRDLMGPKNFAFHSVARIAACFLLRHPDLFGGRDLGSGRDAGAVGSEGPSLEPPALR